MASTGSGIPRVRVLCASVLPVTAVGDISRNIPAFPPPSGVLIVGNTVNFVDGRFDFIECAHEECGDVFVANLLGLGEIYYLPHLDAVRTGAQH